MVVANHATSETASCSAARNQAANLRSNPSSRVGQTNMTPDPRRWLLLYQSAAGLCDATTGALLVLAPLWTLALMKLAIVPQPIAFLRFIGVFVLCVGLSYLWVAVAWPVTEWRGQWRVTALIRTGVATFFLWQVISHAMERGWGAVILTDGILATIQWIGLSRGWLDIAD